MITRKLLHIDEKITVIINSNLNPVTRYANVF